MKKIIIIFILCIPSLSWTDANPLFFKFGEFSPKKGSFDHVRLNSVDPAGTQIEMEVERGQFTKLGSLFLENVKMKYKTLTTPHFQMIHCQKGRMDALSSEVFFDGDIIFNMGPKYILSTDHLVIDLNVKTIRSLAKVNIALGHRKIKGDQFYFDMNKRLLQIFIDRRIADRPIARRIADRPIAPPARSPASFISPVTKIKFSKDFKSYTLLK